MMSVTLTKNSQNNYITNHIQKMQMGLLLRPGKSKSKYSGNQIDWIYPTNNRSIKKLLRKIKKATQLQLDPVGEQKNASQYNFLYKQIIISRCKLLDKNLKFVETQMKYNEKTLNEGIDNFYLKTKLSTHFEPNDSKLPSNKNLPPKTDTTQ